LCRNTAQAIRASLLASATTAAFLCILVIRPRSHAPTGSDSQAALARRPAIKSLRRYLLPRLLIPTRRGLPPVVTCRGTKPSHAAKSRPRDEEAARRLMTIPGIGVLNATALIAAIGQGESFDRLETTCERARHTFLNVILWR
jgi:hypothetical protein